ncbi:MAG: FAD-binding oxidoreductase [Pseudomonadota bacterium]
MENLDSYLSEVRKTLGSDRVASASTSSLSQDQTTFPWAARSHAYIRPRSADELVAAVALAGTMRIPLHPMSRARGWGLGGRQPVADAVVLDMSGMSRIVDLDIENCSATIEPGVTFAQLQAALDAKGLAAHVPSFGGPTDASVLANALERGEGTCASGDRFGSLSNLDIVLSTGERINTGFSRWGACSSRASRIHGRPAGPLLDGLVSQSGFGVVASGTVRLAPTHRFATSIIAQIGTDPAALRIVVAKIRHMVRGGLVEAHDVAFWDSAKRLSTLVQRRATGTVGTTTETPADIGWAASLIVRDDYQAVMQARIKAVYDELHGVAALSLATDRTPDGRRVPTPLTGFSDGQNVRSCYAAKLSEPGDTLDPERDRCGFLWACPVLPFSADALLGVVAKLEPPRDKRVFAALGVQAVSMSALHGYVSIAWDRDEHGSDSVAMDFHDRVFAELCRDGYLPYRLAHPSIQACPDADPNWATVVGRLRSALDPAGILASGRVAGLAYADARDDTL